MDTEERTAKNPEAYVKSLDEAMRTLGWGGKKSTVTLVSILPGETKSGRKRFIIKFEEVK
jgi:hypothetical protein